MKNTPFDIWNCAIVILLECWNNDLPQTAVFSGRVK